MVWDEETIRLLKDLWTQGHSTAEIGRRLNVSKNAIVGKAHRLELDARPSPIRRDVVKPATDRPAAYPRMAGPTLPPLASSHVPAAAGLSVPTTIGSLRSALTMGPHPAPAMGLQSAPPMGLQSAPPMGLRAASPMGPHPASSMGPHPASSMGLHSPPPVGARPVASMGPHPASSVGARPVAPQSQGVAAHRPVMPSAPFPTRRSAPSCCWPIGEPGTKTFRFCDDASVPGKPYCGEHVKLAYVKIRDRKEDAA
jgi:GcrA cell cycle regulator